MAPIHEAARHGDLRRLMILLHDDPLVVNDIKEGYSPLHEASIHGHIDCIEYLLDHVARINQQSRWGDGTALHLVSRLGGSMRVVETLVAK